MIKILVPHFYDSTNNIFSKNNQKKIIISNNYILNKSHIISYENKA